MNNSIKIVTIVGIITSFFSVYPMTEVAYYSIGKIELRKTNPLLKMSQLGIWHKGQHPRKGFDIKKDDPLYTDKGLALSLTAARFFLKHLGEKEEKKSLKTIYDTVSKGTPVTSKYAVQIDNDIYCGIFPRRNPFSIFTVIEEVIEDIAKKEKITLC